MSVYRRKNKDGSFAETYSYEFEIRGHRFSGNTGEAAERRAKVIEREKRAQALKDILNEKIKDTAPWTFDKALMTYFEEKLEGVADASTRSIFVWLQHHIGKTPLLTDVNSAFVAKLIAAKAKDPGVRTGTLVSNATINRTVTEPIRRIMRYASEVHEQDVPKISWGSLRRKEPEERVRELRNDEEVRLFDVLREDYHPPVKFCIVAGLRLEECCELKWNDVDFTNERIWIQGKGDKLASIPLAPAMREILEPLRDNHPEYVFTFVAQRSTINPHTRQKYVKGQLYPITYRGLQTTFKRHREQAGISDFRFHDLRHTAASRILRGSKNLKAVQAVLRHEDIATTMRYAHVLDDDVRSAIQSGHDHTTSNPTKTPRNDD